MFVQFFFASLVHSSTVIYYVQKGCDVAVLIQKADQVSNSVTTVYTIERAKALDMPAAVNSILFACVL